MNRFCLEVLRLGVMVFVGGLSLVGEGACWGQEESAKQVAAARKVLDAYHVTDPVPSSRTLHIVYWTPADREPAPQYRERLTRVLFDIREFYAKEMRRLGFGERTIRLATDEDGLLKVHLVRGAGPYAKYHVQSGDAIRRECLPTLQSAGIEASKETLVIFCNMSNWDKAAATMSQNSPYYASGGLRNGTAWQVDSPLLDAALLSHKEPMLRDGQYGKISVGKYNSIFVGGVCHELGHALGLPHNLERTSERVQVGTSLMGSGNRTYGEERRGEGRGSFLSLCDGLRLASHPLFTGSAKGIDLPASAELQDVKVVRDEDAKGFTFSAKVTADPPVYAVVAYMDPSGGNDYDATTATAIPDEKGFFSLRCDALKTGKAGLLRVVACQANGGRINDQVFAVPYQVAENGEIDLSAFQAKTQLQPLVKAIAQNDAKGVAEELKKVEVALGMKGADGVLLRVARSLAKSIGAKPGPAPAKAMGKECWLSDSAWKAAKVGWGRPVVNRLPDEAMVIQVGGKLFERGLYAHAPSSYAYDLDRKWKKLSVGAGLASGHDGSVEFVIVGDGKTLWSSKRVADAELKKLELDIVGVKELVLKVEDGGDGNGSDWGVWVDPKLER